MQSVLYLYLLPTNQHQGTMMHVPAIMLPFHTRKYNQSLLHVLPNMADGTYGQQLRKTAVLSLHTAHVSLQDTKASQEEVEASEAAALEAASALAAVGALVDGLKAFLSPYLAALLQLLFSPHLLACPQAGCSGAAARIRIQLAAAIPPRLLLAPLFGYLDGAIQVRISPGHVS